MANKAPPVSPHDKIQQQELAQINQIIDDANNISSDSIQDGDFSSNGLMTRTASATYTSRQIVGATGLTVADGTGASGNPTIDYDINALTVQATTTVEDDLVVIYDAALAAHRKVLLKNIAGITLQKVTTSSTADASGTTVVVIDDSIPQNTEGDELFTVAITPTNTANILYIEIDIPVISQGSATDIIGALFQDTTANALAATIIDVKDTTSLHQLRLSYRMTAGTTSSTTFKFRYGGTAGTTYINQNSGGGLLSTSTFASITVTEYTP